MRPASSLALYSIDSGTRDGSRTPRGGLRRAKPAFAHAIAVSLLVVVGCGDDWPARPVTSGAAGTTGEGGHGGGGAGTGGAAGDAGTGGSAGEGGSIGP
ncbi:MAG TPA: hypothetical protein VIQ54_22940, partial [Polyangia bacterium]